jgi:hypothetical protein
MKKHPICQHFQIEMLRNMALLTALLVKVLALQGMAISAPLPGMEHLPGFKRSIQSLFHPTEIPSPEKLRNYIS